MEQYVHHIPGRLRIKIPAIRTEPGKCSDVKELLETLCDVHTVSTNPITGSVVVEFTPIHIRSGCRNFSKRTVLSLML